METLSYCQLMGRCLAAEARVAEMESGKVGNALLERENHHVEVVGKLTERIAELAAENVALKESRNNLAEFIHEELDADYPLNMNLETPATDHIVAAQRSTFVDEAVSKITESGALTFGDCIVALCQLRESAK